MFIKENYLKRQLLLGLATSLLALTLGAPPAKAQLAVDNLVVDFADPKVSRRDMTLSNTGKEKLYVEVKVEEVLPGPDGKQVTRTGTPDQLGLLVTPTKLILGPGQRRPVRAVLLQRPTSDRMYHVSLRPAVGDVLADPAASGKMSMNVMVVLGYKAVILARPAKIDENLQASRSGRTLRFDNRGNVSLFLQSGRQCPDGASAPAACTPLPDKRVWPGRTWDVALPLDGPVTYIVSGPSGEESHTY